jgi:pyrroline-5-carboxylate reductase
MSVTAFIGGGNMARALIGGQRQQGMTRIQVGEPEAAARAGLERDYEVSTFASNADAVAGAALVVVAVKPQAAARAVGALAGKLGADTCVVSIMAGVPLAKLRRWLGDGPQLVRAMPNTPALVGAGVTALYADPSVGDNHRAQAQSVFDNVGASLWLDREELMDAVTAVSGSGPAYLFLVLEALTAAGRDAGLDPEIAHNLAAHMLHGAAKMAVTSTDAPEVLRRNVTSPGGTTEAALAVLEAHGLRRTFAAAVTAAIQRARTLAAQED